MADRVILFLDYQNVYMSARSLFHTSGAAHWNGQIDPRALGQLLVERSPYDRELTGVRIYRGIPDSTKDPKGYGACQRQISAWARSPETEVTTRTLRYPFNWPAEKPEEKGIDVALALDFALMAVRGEFDVGVLMSTDTDLKPALEAVADAGTARTEVAAWSKPHSYSRRLSISGRKLWCHWLDETDYHRVQDTRDYNIP
ncbi:MAG: NYN domain-containing protein [Acidimicrobiia bacterium]